MESNDAAATHNITWEMTHTTSARSDSLAELAPALAKAQSQLTHAVQDSVNKHFDYKYANLSRCWDAIQKPFTDNGFSIVQLPCTEDDSVGCETMLIHSSGEWIKSRFLVPVDKPGAHGAMSALTYCRRGSLSAMCGIVSDPDDDGNAASQPPKGKRVSNRKPKRPAQVPYDPESHPKAALAIGKAESNVELKETFVPGVMIRLGEGAIKHSEARSLLGLIDNQMNDFLADGLTTEANVQEIKALTDEGRKRIKATEPADIADTEKQMEEVF